jgi:PIN domain nuclease of toxin-antitoxin system
VRLLLDTHLLLWAAGPSPRLSSHARLLIEDPTNELLCSVASLWEIAIKSALRRANFGVDARLFRRNLLNNGYQELAVTGEHAVGVANLPPLHNDPFDRILVAQSVVEGITVLTPIRWWRNTRRRCGEFS